MHDNLFVKDFKHYQILGWQNYISTTSLLILKELWSMEQITNYDNNHNAFSKIRIFSVSDKQLMELLGIGSKNTIKQAILQLEEYNLISIVSERSKNHIGTATEYLITKPIPIPEEIKTPSTLSALYGTVWCNKVIKELIQLNEETSKNDPSINKNIHNTFSDSETTSDEKPAPNKRQKNKKQTREDEDIFDEKKTSKIKAIVETLSRVEAFKVFSQIKLENSIIRLAQDDYIDVLEEVANYFYRHGYRNRIKNLYGFLKYFCENPESLKEKERDIDEPTLDDEEFLKNSILDTEKKVEYDLNPNSFNFLD